MDRVEKALSTFHKAPYKYNCAQAVCHAFSDVSGITPETMEEYKAYGGGRASLGRCGALYGALTHVRDCQTRQKFTKDFVEVCKYPQCKLIKGKAKIPCETCIATAVKMLEGELEEKGFIHKPVSFDF
ncbi:hypothetical protein ADUPG1_011886 [Aduncisulcus paluster]|uniref:Uncharacterized protein n=1 Tax=Aduncisulcus paluster TaxID=2918883 RepID=A0ABQ5JXI5_9EUKA|nr:hypothetical protein ADUPG1_011886 [Aduncisulcus paluster]|eukprot:gnl/Carplike_NY0171/78_a104_9100.p1 GENE.gnl/Carplike_NY0171/78_a104_9100~~gnl/Carplike_NY0171/78_a104_9100.p1  ORF type:complete len:128 (+),score=24.30 gnl/Carplike_NY0171/78_a104_9100:40-423(+)